MLCSALLFTKPSNSQVDPTTGNILSATGWTGAVYKNATQITGIEEGNWWGGPAYNTDTNTIRFSFGKTDTVSQTVGINQALASIGNGIQVSGFNYNFKLMSAASDTLTATYTTTNASGDVIQNNTFNFSGINTNGAFVNSNTIITNNTVNYTTPYAPSSLGTITASFSGHDGPWWAGLYGPRVREPSITLNYQVDPCATNPAYSSTCAGFNKVINTTNLLPSNDFAGSYNQAIAINTALTSAGVGAMVHGFNYGFSYKVGQSWSGCTATNQDGSCSWYMDIPASARVTASLTSNTNQSLYQKVYSYTGDNTNGNVSEKFLLPSSLNQSSLGTARLSGSSMGTGSEVGNFWASIIYTADPCANDPLYSTNCKGYAAAFAAKLSASNTIAVQASTSTPTIESSTSSTPTTNVGGVQMSTTGSISAPDNIPQALKDIQAIAQQSQLASTQSSKSTPNMSLIMSLLNQVQANDKATQTAAVQNAQQVAATSAAKAQEQANQVVEALNTMSQASSQASMLQLNNNTQSSAPTNQQSSSVVQLQQPTAATQMTFVSPIQSISLTPPQQTLGQVTFGSANITVPVLAPQVSVTKYESQQKVDTSLVASVAPQFEQPKFENKQQEVDMPTVSFNTSMSRGSNVNDLFASKINIESLQSEQSIDTVNKNVSANELAGNVDIASIATTPKGYEAYSFVLQDAAFYKVEAIYKDQKTVDNARAFRSLSNDRLHQEMVDQQYKGK